MTVLLKNRIMCDPDLHAVCLGIENHYEQLTLPVLFIFHMSSLRKIVAYLQEQIKPCVFLCCFLPITFS